MDVLADIIDVFTKLTVVQALNHIVGIETVLGLRCRFNVPDKEWFVHRFGNGVGEHRFSCTRFSLDEQWFLQRDCNIDSV